VLVANSLAVLLVDYKGDPQSLQKAFALSRDFEKEAPHPLFLDTLGWVRFKMGQQEEALRLMKNAVAKSPEFPTLNYHLGMAYHQSGKLAEARAHLSRALKSVEAFEGRQEAERILLQMRG
jgi:predicted Zn-dependent protease